MRVKRNLLLACILAGLATATRNVGIFLVVPLMFECIPRYVLVAFPVYRARAPGQKEASLLRMVDSERHDVNNPLRAVCELAIRRLNGARRINHAPELSRPAVQM